MGTEKDNLKKCFEGMLATISEQEFDSLLKEVEPFSYVGPEVMHYMHYTQAWIETDLMSNKNCYSFENQTKWFDTDAYTPLAA